MFSYNTDVVCTIETRTVEYKKTKNITLTTSREREASILVTFSEYLLQQYKTNRPN